MKSAGGTDGVWGKVFSPEEKNKRKIRKGGGKREGDGVKMRWIDIERREMRILRSSWMEDGKLEPLHEIEDRGDAFVLTFDLPNVRKEDVEVKTTEDTVEVSARMQRAVCWERWGCVQRSVSFEAFKKTVRLPEKVNAEEAKATLKNGILQIILPKKKKRVSVPVL